MIDIRDKFILKDNKKNEPYYKITIMQYDEDDSESTYTKEQWNSIHPLFFLVLSFLNSGEFTHFKEQEKLEFPFVNSVNVVDYTFCWLKDFCEYHFNFYGIYVDGIKIKYIDENKQEFDVQIPKMDKLFKTQNEMLKEINKAYQDYHKSCED